MLRTGVRRDELEPQHTEEGSDEEKTLNHNTSQLPVPPLYMATDSMSTYSHPLAKLLLSPESRLRLSISMASYSL